ncbi:tail fiber protein [Bacillus phage Bastille]|uniref:Minor structural protein/ putative tail fiber n=1 Tax=Bacillus phage Bastille TaxID=57477 RepID=J9PM59_9CAUD|nr:tail fiber protein [Bacillus phage Bastille]AEQ34226.1 minor structural protein/ putative tail fiber [Bacillus phage Bastille]
MSEFETPLNPLRIQAQLGKDVKRLYKEGSNIVTLSFAKVVKVNYKYNTVDVITTRHKNSTTKNPNDNGKFSAKLPIAFGGRTANGNVYGTNTLVTVGSTVLIGFLEGQVDNPIVINIYGENDNQSMLTRTTMTSGDDSEEIVQRELWQLFNLYPSMTYENIDGRGNREVTFSGKTFLYITDTDQENAYVQDGAFDYMDLPSSRYANGELIEPESPKAPTLLYVHQGIYDDHRFTVFIKSDGTFRVGSRHTKGDRHGITYQQMNPDGSFSIVKKNDTTDPEEESYDQSSMEILPNGNVLLQNPQHKFEITEEGVLVDGKEIGSGGGNGGGDYDEAIKEINDALSRISITVKAVEGGLETKVEKDTYEIDLDEVKGAQERLLAEIKTNIADLKNALEDLRTFIGSGFPDGQVTDARKVELNKKLQNIDVLKSVVDGKYDEVMADPFIGDTSKTPLQNAKNKIDGYHQALHNVIDASITDGVLTAQEKSDINKAITNYVTALADIEIVFASSIQESIKARLKEAVDNPVNYTSKEMLRQSSVLTQLFNSLTLKVSSEQLTSQVQNLESKMATKEEQKEIKNELEKVNEKVDGTLSNLPYRVEVSSTNGTIFVNDYIDTRIYAKIYKGAEDVTAQAALKDIIWTRVSDDTAADAAWNSSHVNIGDSFQASVNDVKDRATFFCAYKTPAVATGSITVANLRDITVSDKEPANPRNGTMWFDTKEGKLKIFLNNKWEVSSKDLDFNIRNLFLNSRDCTGGGWTLQSATRTNNQYQGTYIIETAINWGSADYACQNLFTRGVVKKGDKVTYCVLARLTGATGVSKDLRFYCENAAVNGSIIGQVTTEWKQFYVTIDIVDAMNTAGSKMRVEVADLEAANLKLQTTSPILVQGEVAVNWIPAPEDTQRDIDDLNTNVNSLGDDSKLTRFERSLVRTALADITGVYYNPTDTPATIAQIDTTGYGKGKLYALRQQARNLGLDTTKSPNYKKLGDAYTALVTYLSGFTPKAWDTTSGAIVAIPDRAVWNKLWNDYNNFYALFEIEVQDRQKEFTEQETLKMQKETIGAISQVGNYDTATLVNPTTTVTPPIATLGLPEFSGRTSDARTIGGVNIIKGTKTAQTVVGENRSNQTKNIYDFADGNSASMIGKVHTVMFSWEITPDANGEIAGTMYMQGSNPYPAIASTTTFSTNNTSGVYTDLCTVPSGTASFISVNMRCDNMKGTLKISNMKIADGDIRRTIQYSPSPNEGYFDIGNRIRPVTNPTFYNGTQLTIFGKFHGMYGYVDRFYWNENGVATKEKYWEDFPLDDKQNWSLLDSRAGTSTQNKVVYSSGNGGYPRLFDDNSLPSNQTNRNGGSTASLVSNYVNLVCTNPSDSFFQIGGYDQGLHNFTNGEQLTISVDINCDVTDAYVAFWFDDGNGWYESQRSVATTAGSWNRIVNTMTVPAKAQKCMWRVYFPRVEGSRGKTLRLKNVMVVAGTNSSWHEGNLSFYRRFKSTAVMPYQPSSQNLAQMADLNGFYMASRQDTNAPNQFTFDANKNELIVSVNDLDTGFDRAYTSPTADEIKAYFLGWKLCDGTSVNSPYKGSGVKVWFPIGDTNLDRKFQSNDGKPPKDVSPSFQERVKCQPYQFVGLLDTPVALEVEFEGILELLPKANAVTVAYPNWTPEISTGKYKYGINLATVNQDTRYLVPAMQKRISNAEQKITDKAITSTVINSIEYQLGLKEKANASDLSGLASKNELDKLSHDVDDRIQKNIDKLDFTPYVTKSDLEQTSLSWAAKFLATGGMNIANNSIGFAGMDFWFVDMPNTYNTPTVIATALLDSLGFGKGFQFKADNTKPKSMSQDLSTIPNQPYTISWYLDKFTGGASLVDHRFNIEILEQNDAGAWFIVTQLNNNNAEVTDGFKASYMTFTPTKGKVRLRITAGKSCEAIISGIMVNIGDVPIPWTLSTGELYNTNIQLNINGIRVSQLDANKNEIGYTMISPTEFAGYYSNNGQYEKVFWLNGDETVTKKLRATQEINLGNVKVLDVNGVNTGWAFISNY